LSKAIGRLVVSYKDIQNLAGYTTLINEMDEVLQDLSSGRYSRVMVVKNESSELASASLVRKATMSSTFGAAKVIRSDNIIFD
jgi:ATP-binding cassette subfamily D (ALD) protein 3